jgi:hypothetical protein
MDCGRYWAGSRATDKSNLADDCNFFGIDQPAINEPEHMEVLPENWKTLQIFLQCQTQWRIIAGMAGAFYQGLDYPSVESVLRMTVKPKNHAKTFRGLQLIEAGALETINKKD